MVDFKMCSAATSAKTNLNLKIAAGYCPVFSSPSCCSCSKACTTTGNDTKSVQGVCTAGPTCLARSTQFPARTLQLFTYRLNNHSRSRELITFLYDVADQTNF